MQTVNAWAPLAYLLMFLGVVGSLLPLIPGALLIWVGALIWAWGDGFRHFGWAGLFLLGAIMVITWLSDLAITSAFTRRAGGSWKTVVGAMLGGLLGALILTILPGVGTVIGAILGAIGGIVVVEYRTWHNWRRAARASLAYIAGYIVAAVVQVTLCLTMIGIFIFLSGA